jgi:hypothetical protein
MDIGAILIGLAALILVVFLIGQPLMDGRQRGEKTLSEADRLRDQRDQILVTLRDLDFDHASGKVLEEDYAPLRASLVAEGAAVLKQLDELKPAGPAPLEDQLEQAVAARRHGAEADRAPAGSTASDASAEADAVERAVAARRRRPAPAASPAGGTSAEADAVEQAIAARRQRSRSAAASSEKVYCSQCGQAALPGDKFCAKCGAKLLGAPSTKDPA